MGFQIRHKTSKKRPSFEAIDIVLNEIRTRKNRSPKNINAELDFFGENDGR
jgi:hypothetical protein